MTPPSDDNYDSSLFWNEEDDEYTEEGGDLTTLTRALLDELGFQDIGDIIVDFEGADLSALRGDRFSSAEETLVFLYDIGIIDFSDIVYIEEEELYGYLVIYE